MASQNETGHRTFTAGAALEPWRRVKLGSDGETVVYADADDKGIGVTQGPAFKAGDSVPVRLFTAPGTHKIESSGVIADAARAFAASDGMIAATGSVSCGRINGAAQANSINEVYHQAA